jgi:hypothetical protein
MTDLYFACAWIIRANTDYDRLMHLAAESECDLVAVAPIQISQQGFAVMTFALRTPSEAHLVEFVQVAGAEMGLTHWYGVPESYFATGKPLYLNILPDDMRESWLAGMNAYGQHNEEQRKKLEG